MIIKTATDRIDDGIERGNKVYLKLRLRDDANAYTGWFMLYDVQGCEIIPRQLWVCDINRTALPTTCMSRG